MEVIFDYINVVLDFVGYEMNFKVFYDGVNGVGSFVVFYFL